jgi:dTDP-4-amino-4,6-dideoxygalactose transaminase
MAWMAEAMQSGHISGNGMLTQRCQQMLEARYGFRRVLLTTSCTDALEMAAILLNIEPGDEVIMPSYTFVSTANAFVLRGARIIFADSHADRPGMDEHTLEGLVTPKTKAIVVMHYAGVACDMDIIMDIAGRHGIKVVEDAAHAIGAHYRGRPLGGIGHLGAYSFHETKNIQCGEGGALIINDPALVRRAEVIWEKGTNRAAFHRGEVDCYEWVDVGSSFLPSELTAAFLLAQLEAADTIQHLRDKVWQHYANALQPLFVSGLVKGPVIPEHADNNAHLFHLICGSREQRDALLSYLNERGVNAVFHYLPLHRSPFHAHGNNVVILPNAERYGDCLLRLPLHTGISAEDAKYITGHVMDFFLQKTVVH